MKSEGLSVRAAAEALVRVHPRAWPNEGFRRALDMCVRAPAASVARQHRRRVDLRGSACARPE